MLTVYGRGQSRSFRALWALTEAEVPFEYIEVTDELKSSAEYLAINSQGKVPSLVNGKLHLTESAAMVSYAGALAPADAKLLPTATAERARYDDVCYFVLSDFEQPLWTIGKHRFALPEAQRQASVLDTASWEYAKSEQALLKLLAQRQFAVGDHFTLADVLVAHTINWAIRFEMAVAEPLVAYRDFHYQRPACIDSLALVA